MKRIVAAVAAVIMGVMAVSAMPAKRMYRTYALADGSTVEATKVGDEYGHYYLDRSGRPLIRNAAGQMCLASDEAINTIRTEALSRKQSMAARAAARAKIAASRAESFQSPYLGLGRFSSSYPRQGKIKSLVFLVEYTDVKFKISNPQQYFSRQLNEEGFSDHSATGSAYDYFTAQSHGAFDPDFEVYGPVQLKNKMSYYGGNDDARAPEMVVEAAQALDGEIDFSQYDYDGDGNVDNVYVIYAGYGEADYDDANTVWPHAYELWEKVYRFDGKRLYGYACGNELAPPASYYDKTVTPNGVGTFCHEFSHVLGLPDIYNIDDPYDETTPSSYDIMDYGPYNNDGRTPPNYSAVERNALGWTVPTEYAGPAHISLESLDQSNEAYFIPTNLKNEFFVVENRQQRGWDAYLPGHGMLIWHISFNQAIWDANEPTVPHSGYNLGLDLVEACGYADASWNSSYTKQPHLAKYPFPGTLGIDSFTADTDPALRTWAGLAIDYPLTDISENAAGVISFDVCAGSNVSPFSYLTPVTLGGTRSGDKATVYWEALDGAVDYAVSARAVSGEGGSSEETHDFGSNDVLAIPSGYEWTGRTTDFYKSTSTPKALVASGAPVLKFARDGVALATSLYQYPITEVSFWLVANASSASVKSVFNIYARATATDAWQLVKAVDNINSYEGKGATVAVDVPAGMHQMRFAYTKPSGGGNLGFDNLHIVTSSLTYTSVADRRLVGNVTSAELDVPAEATAMSYYIEAIDNEGAYSRPSVETAVDFTSGLETLAEGTAEPELYTVDGRRVAAGARLVPGIYIERRGAASRKVVVK